MTGLNTYNTTHFSFSFIYWTETWLLLVFFPLSLSASICIIMSDKRLNPSLLDAGVLQRLVDCELPTRNKGSGCFHVPHHWNTGVVCSAASSVLDSSQWSRLVVDCPDHFLIELLKRTWETSVESSDKSWGSFQSWVNSAFINLAQMRRWLTVVLTCFQCLTEMDTQIEDKHVR